MKQSRITEQTNPERRRFLEICGRYGFTTAVLASTGGYLWSDDAIAQTAADEEAKQKAAKSTMLFATEYKNEDPYLPNSHFVLLGLMFHNSPFLLFYNFISLYSLLRVPKILRINAGEGGFFL